MAKDEVTKQNILKAIASSYVVWALVAFISLDVLARVVLPDHGEQRLVAPNRSWVWWAVRDYQKLSQAPDIVLMGSSLMMTALYGADATYFQKPRNVALHHRSDLLEKLLEEKTGEKVNTAAFAIGGQMASDAYALSSTLFSGPKKPGVIIYGIAPRDFMDNTLASPASTETFKYMERVGDLSGARYDSRSSIWEWADFAVNSASAICNHRPEILFAYNEWWKSCLKRSALFNDLEAVHTPFALRKIALLELPEDQGPNDLEIVPYDVSSSQYIDNSQEYRMRYASFRKKNFDQQMRFLERMLDHCRKEQIKVILVNMPLTVENLGLMPSGLYDAYLDHVRHLATKYGASVLNMNKPSVFPKTYFADSVHMNGRGGVKFFQELANAITAQTKVASGQRGLLQ